MFQDPHKIRAPVLYLQADNCFKENKNRYVFFFCALLVALDFFEDVYMSFLPTGHTHEDIDALFSYLRMALSRNNYSTLPALLEKIVPIAYNGHIKPKCIIQPGIYDWKSWSKHYIPPIVNHTKPHVFHFKRSSENSQVCNFVKLVL